jgi:hypothetical protein
MRTLKADIVSFVVYEDVVVRLVFDPCTGDSVWCHRPQLIDNDGSGGVLAKPVLRLLDRQANFPGIPLRLVFENFGN